MANSRGIERREAPIFLPFTKKWDEPAVAFSFDGQFLASGSEDHTVRIWRLGSSVCLWRLEGHESWVRAVAFSTDGQYLASGGDDHTVRLWDVETGRCLHVWKGHTGRVRSVAFHPSGKQLVSGGEDQTILAQTERFL
jgi:WD40 repeat protein